MNDPGHRAGPKILIIDDTPANIDVLCEMFESAGYEVLVAMDGTAGQSTAERSLPDLILLDVLMPGLNGFETCQELKRHSVTRPIPVIFLSAKDDPSNMVEGFRVGGVDYISKPFQKEEVLARVKTHLTMAGLHQELNQKNQALHEEIQRCKNAELEVKKLNLDLENRIAERTARLEVLNQDLEQDIAARKKAEEALQEFPRRIIEAQEAERQRVAQELHDSVTQILLSAKYRLNWMLEQIGDRKKSDRKIAVSVRELLEMATEEVRAISRNLRPPELDDLGLLAATRSICTGLGEWTGIEFDLQFADLPKRLPAGTELNLYRIVQESLNNVRKHAKASQVEIRLGRKDSFLELMIRDNGSGFDASATTSARIGGGGFGMISMRERARCLNGIFEVKSVPGAGTEIVVRIPLQDSAKSGKPGEKKARTKNQNPAGG